MASLLYSINSFECLFRIINIPFAFIVLSFTSTKGTNMDERPAKVIFDPSQGPQKSVAAYSGEFGSLVVVLWLIMVANSAKQTCKVIFCRK